MSPPNGPTLLRPPRMDYNRMNSFLEYPLCNRGPSAYSAHSAPTSFPPSSAPAVDSYAGETRYGGGLPSPALQQNSGYPAQQPPSALGVPFPSSATSGYAPAACSPSYGPSQYYPLGQPEGDGGYYHPSSYGAQLGGLSDGYGTGGAGPGPYPPPPQPPFGSEQAASFASAYADLLSEDKESPCPSEPSTPTARTFDWMKVKRNPPKTGMNQAWPTSSPGGAQSSSAAPAVRGPGLGLAGQVERPWSRQVRAPRPGAGRLGFPTQRVPGYP